jgi:hypothetical protein
MPERFADQLLRKLCLSLLAKMGDERQCPHLADELFKFVKERIALAEFESRCKAEALDKCQQIAGIALGYPWYKDDQKNFPGATEKDGVCLGEHADDTVVAELAKAYSEKVNKVTELLERIEDIGYDAMERAERAAD